MEVVGTVDDVRGVSLSDPPSPTVYFPFWQRSFNRSRFSLAVKTGVETAGVASSVREAIRELDRDQSVAPFRTMDDVVDGSLASRRFQTGLVVLFGGCALLLAMLGTYGVISYSVSQRTNEIGIRLALGAARERVVGEVLAGALRLLGFGLAAGVPLAVATGYGLRSVLYGVAPHDAVVVAGTCGVLAVASIVAALAPAWRASRVDPIVALRQE
jgi:ABC-type antimicrobial peptide transport system permease subunit